MIPNGDMQSPENHNGKETEWKVAMGVTRGKSALEQVMKFASMPSLIPFLTLPTL